MDKLKLILGALLAIVLGLFSLERLKRKKAETLLENEEVKRKDDKLDAIADKFMEENKGLMEDLAKMEEAEKKLKNKELTPQEAEDYWKNKK